MATVISSPMCDENTKRSASDRLFIEDCAESFRVVAQTAGVPLDEHQIRQSELRA
jgi:hypothetical protein